MRFLRFIAALIACASLAGCTDDDSTAASNASSTGSATSVGETPSSESSGSSETRGTSSGSGTSTGGGTSTGLGTADSSSEGSSSGREICEAPRALSSCDGLADAPGPFEALGLGCPGGAEAAIPLVGSSFASADPNAWTIGTHLGTHVDPMSGEPTWGPTEGEQLLMISTGFIAEPDREGVVAMEVLDQDANDNPDDKPLPAPINPIPGGGGMPLVDCDGLGDCSNSLWNQWLIGGAAAMDLLWFQLRAEVPAGTHGFQLDFALFSEEFPESVGTTFNDMFVVWSSTETYVGNLCFVDEQPCTVTALWPVEFPEFAPELEGTGFAANDFDEGAGTGWLQIRGSAAPHEELELTFALFDMGDEELDTLVLLDGFAWDCEGCTATPDNPCGVVEPR